MEKPPQVEIGSSNGMLGREKRVGFFGGGREECPPQKAAAIKAGVAQEGWAT
jgi:hypothetical protein